MTGENSRTDDPHAEQPAPAHVRCSGWPQGCAWHSFLAFAGSYLDDVMRFVDLWTGRNVAGENHSDHAFLDYNSVTDFELWFIGVAFDCVSGRLLHFSIMALRAWFAGS